MTDQLDSLEDWVAIKEHPFLDKVAKTYGDFLVEWNTEENKFAVTCRERQTTRGSHLPSIAPSNKPGKAWSGIFSIQEIIGIHQQLCLIHPSLFDYLPDLPVQPSGMWAYMYSPVDIDGDKVSQQLHAYLRVAVDICGLSLVSETLFEEHSYDEYFEKMSELKRRKHDEAVTLAEDQLRNVLFLRDGAINMCDMSEVYLQEDEAGFKLNIALSELYIYQMQPFLDMREAACNKLREAKNGLENPNLGERRKSEYRVMFTEWHENYVHALDRIQQLYIEYYSKTVELQASECKSLPFSFLFLSL